MNNFYTTLENEKLSMKSVTEEQRRMLKEIYILYRNNTSLPEFFNRINSMRLPSKDNIAYKIISDMESALGILQGYYSGDIEISKILDNNKALEQLLD